MRARHLLFALAFTLAAKAGFAQAVEATVTQGTQNPIPIAITNLTGAGDGEANGAAIASVVSADLASSGLFRPISQAAFIEQITNGDATPRFPDWRQINAQAVMTPSPRWVVAACA